MKEKKQGTMAKLFAIAGAQRSTYYVGTALCACGIFASAIPFYCVYQIIRSYMLPGTQADRTAWIWITAISILAGAAISLLGSILCHKATYRVLYQLRMGLLEHMGRLNLGFYTGGRAGEVQKMMDENMEKIEGFLSHNFPNIVGAVCVLLVLTAFLFYINWMLAVVVLVVIVAAFLIQFSAFGGEKGKGIWTNMNQAATDLDAEFLEYIRGIEEEKIFGNTKVAAERLTGVIETHKKAMLSYLKRVTPIFGAYKTIILSLLAFIVLGGIALIRLNGADPSLLFGIISFMIVGPAIYSPLTELVEIGADMRNVAVRLKQIEDIFSLPTLPVSGGNGDIQNHSIVFEHVDFSYHPISDSLHRHVLKNVSFVLPEGKVTALVGPSGGGKSTAAQLIARFWDVEAGTITIGKTDIRDMPIDGLMDQISFVFQDTHIFSATLWENLTMNRKVSKPQADAAMKAARCEDILQALPCGYDTMLGSGGHALSGGEAQRIAIARAILKDAPIVLLDEAMSFADAENEALLKKAIASLLKGKTVLLIAHRLYSIRHADNIIVLADGQIAEQGTHETLLEKKGLYHRLWYIQNDIESWTVKGGVIHAEV